MLMQLTPQIKKHQNNREYINYSFKQQDVRTT